MTLTNIINRYGSLTIAGMAGFLHLEIAPTALAQTNTAVAKPAASPLVVPGFAGNIQGIKIVPQIKDVNLAGITGQQGIVVGNPAFLRSAGFENMLKAYLGKPLTEASLDQLQTEIIRHCRKEGHLVVDAFFADQNIREGIIQIAVVEGKVGQVTVENEGRKWFSDDSIRSKIRLQPGDVVVKNRLDTDLSWLNRATYQSLGEFGGTFREVNAGFTQGGLGETDVKVTVQDRFPVRPYAGYDNAGSTVIGSERFFAGVDWANAFFVGHRLSYQYLTDSDFDKLKQHVVGYTVPLPWRHDLVLFGAYAVVNPDYSLLGQNFAPLKTDGEVLQLSGRYSIPLPQVARLEHELTLGFDFKRTDTPLLQTTVNSVLGTNKIDVAQFSVGYVGKVRDRWGSTAISLQGVYSPGDITEFNKNPDFNEFRRGTETRYLYGKVEARRDTLLPGGFSWLLRGAGQMADSRLVPSETFTLGGSSSVRGYNERTVAGDYGWQLNNEIRTPKLVLGNSTERAGKKDWLQGLVFCDYGGTITRQANNALGERYGEVLLSVGAGLRYEMADNLHLRFDYGYQLNRGYLTSPNNVENQGRGRVHVGIEISY